VKIPNADAAIISTEKIRDYLLSDAHPIGRYKAAFFRQLGFEREKPEALQQALRQLLQGDSTPAEATEYGQKYLTRGALYGPAAAARVTAVWIIIVGEWTPRFVTAYPED
jgi:hypothetical protein